MADGKDFSSIADQFRDLSLSEIRTWPPMPQRVAGLLLALAVALGGWVLLVAERFEALEQLQSEQDALRSAYATKLTQVAHMDALNRQKDEIAERVAILEKQLPGKDEMDSILQEVNRAGLARGLQFELFKPSPAEVKAHYAEIPVAIRLTGNYAHIGQFAADVAALSRIVVLGNLSMSRPPGSQAAQLAPDVLVMEARARAFRQLDADEIEAKSKANAAATGVNK